jgi:ubiquinone biosynthesis monooxygenase Coq7
MRNYSLLDKFLIHCDQAVRTLSGNTAAATRENPAVEIDPSSNDPKHSAALMRVNHVGEVCAQALYQGQAITARSPEVREQMQHAASEEVDHLAWCQQRLNELNSHTSYLNPLWYTGSLAIGMIAGLAGDKWSLGFLAETEQQVSQHLDNHLQQLPTDDLKSRKIVEQMRIDEQQHAELAINAGAAELPEPIKQGMRFMSKIMTTVAYKI